MTTYADPWPSSTSAPRRRRAARPESARASARLARQDARPRSSIDALLDRGSPSSSTRRSRGTTCTAATARPAEWWPVSDSSRTGIPSAGRRRTMPRSRAARTTPIAVKKHLRAQEVAAENRLPCVYLVDPAAPSCPCRTRSSPTGTTSATTRPHVGARRHPRRSPPSSARPPPAAPTCPR